MFTAIAKSDEVLKPLLQACDSNNPKMVAIGVGSLHKLIAQNAVSEVYGHLIVFVLDDDDDDKQRRSGHTGIVTAHYAGSFAASGSW